MKWTNAQKVFVETAYKLMPISDIATAFNNYFGTSAKTSQIRAMIKNHGMKSGRNGQFVIGISPWNAGTKGIMKANIGTFKKGNRPQTWVPVGTETKETKDGYWKVKISDPRKWKFKHRLIWEEHHGKIPIGKIVVFRDGDKDNCAIENLQLIDRGTLAQYNIRGGPALPTELRTPFRTAIAIEITARKRERDV